MSTVGLPSDTYYIMTIFLIHDKRMHDIKREWSKRRIPRAPWFCLKSINNFAPKSYFDWVSDITLLELTNQIALLK